MKRMFMQVQCGRVKSDADAKDNVSSVACNNICVNCLQLCFKSHQDFLKVNNLVKTLYLTDKVLTPKTPSINVK